jgi:hypothetical protein
MSAAIKMIHVARREIGIADDDYRALLERVTGSASLRAMSDRQHQDVIAEMKRLGFAPKARTGRLDGPFAGKLLALWLSGWNLGVFRSPHDQALIAFVERQTGIAHVRWVREARDAARAIEGLKKWIAREAGLEWPAHDDARAHKLAVITAQHRKLGFAGEYVDHPVNTLGDLDNIIGALGKQIREAT